MPTESPHRPLREAGGVELELATDHITSLLREALVSRLVAVDVIGSLAAGDAHPALSDLDLIIVVDSVIADDTLVGIGEQLAEAAAEVPMRGLEAVVYRADVLAAPSYPLTIELNVNAGAKLERSSLPGQTCRSGSSSTSPRPETRPSCSMVRRHDPRTGPDTVLNLARTWRWLEEDDWASKTQAGRWALDRTREPEVVAAALA